MAAAPFKCLRIRSHEFHLVNKAKESLQEDSLASTASLLMRYANTPEGQLSIKKFKISEIKEGLKV